MEDQQYNVTEETICQAIQESYNSSKESLPKILKTYIDTNGFPRDYALPNWPYGLIWCKTVQYLIHVTAYLSVYTLVLMSIDRFLAVVRPVESLSYRTERNAVLSCIAVWGIVLLCCIPLYNAHGLRAYTPDLINYYEKCQFISGGVHSLLTFQIVFFVSSYLIPLGLIVTLYMHMLFRLWGTGPQGHPETHIRDKRRATRLVIVVVVIFAVCWLPIQLFLLLKTLLNVREMNLTLVFIQVFSNVLAYMNSCVNPILYAFLSESFRKSFRKLMPWGSPERQAQQRRFSHAAPSTAHRTTTTVTANRTDRIDLEMASAQEVKPL
ncbi:unnamed protein product [Cyprideis torosa]|uniref:Uncharacterized protein n=1 Tax=Cyprideis torosa TaxID=163714 RepID=A0A7R8VZW5_9CRUS|nr:unnamed protein product [Cyprideis torosa]CAG0879083.1 unnamed protein product [Cyprideis torosa]